MTVQVFNFVLNFWFLAFVAVTCICIGMSMAARGGGRGGSILR